MENVARSFNNSPDNDTSKVIDVCCNLLFEIFREEGQHARSAVGMTLQRDYVIGIEMILETK